MAHILVIDDNESLRDLIHGMLVSGGHTVAAASNGLDAVKLFRTAPADLVITDIVMPYDGLATIRVLRGEYPSIPIIAISGGGEFRLDYARGLGANRTLAKPFSVDELNTAIAGVLPARPPAKPKA